MLYSTIFLLSKSYMLVVACKAPGQNSLMDTVQRTPKGGNTMTRKNLTIAVLAAAMTLTGASAVFAEGPDKIDVQGVKFEIPEEIKDLVTVTTEGLKENELVSAYETGSVEAAKAMDMDDIAAGWLFTISTMPEDEVKELRCGTFEGMDIFAEGEDDIYYIFNHPTDVRYVRESTEEMQEDQEDWSKATGWAYGTVRTDILLNNPELEAKHYTNTSLDSNLCRIAFKDDTNYEIRTLQYPDLDASAYKDDEYVEKLIEGVSYAYVDKPEDADGEYIVLAFPDKDVRYDFLLNPENANIIREVYTINGEDYESFYQASFDDPENTATGIMQDWVNAIANGEADDDDAEEDD